MLCKHLGTFEGVGVGGKRPNWERAGGLYSSPFFPCLVSRMSPGYNCSVSRLESRPEGYGQGSETKDSKGLLHLYNGGGTQTQEIFPPIPWHS